MAFFAAIWGREFMVELVGTGRGVGDAAVVEDLEAWEAFLAERGGDDAYFAILGAALANTASVRDSVLNRAYGVAGPRVLLHVVNRIEAAHTVCHA